MRTLEKKKKEESKETFDELKKKMEEIKTKTSTRWVKVIWEVTSLCGCGRDGDEVEIAREVPFDSPLKDGDRISAPAKGDVTWKDYKKGIRKYDDF